MIIKNKPGMSENPVPPSTLSQAGTLVVATSSAWDSKAVMSAWWVDANQVSKTALTGDLLPNGSFVIRGDKKFLPPAQLLLGFGIMFKVSEESKVRHLRHRIQDRLTPSGFAKDVESKENSQDDKDGRESQAEDEHSEAHKDAKQDLRHIQDADGVESNSGDDSENDSDSDLMRGNPLQPTSGKQSASRPGRQASDDLAGDIGTASDEAMSSESTDEKDGSEQQEHAPGDEKSFADTDQKHDLSAEESRLLRKGPRPLPSTVDPAEAAPTSTDSEGNEDPRQSSMSSLRPDRKTLPPRMRGKHGKYQKLKTKYANQDEEDRALAMRLLGSAAAQEKATEDAAANADRVKELAAQKERRRKQHALAAEKGKEAEELRKMEFEQGIETLDDNDLDGLDLESFVGTPLPGDEILDALVVCGPWDAIGGRYKWRVKLQPGTTKKGKAVREILGKWNGIVTQREKKKKKRPGSSEGDEAMLKEEKVRMREGELIKAIREPEVIGVVPVGKVRVIMGPGEASGQGNTGGGAGKGKRGGKGGKKQR